MPAGVTAPPDAMFSSNPLTAIPAAIKYGVTAPIQSISAAINSPTPTGTIRSQGARTGGARVVGGQQQTATVSGLQTVVPNAGASTNTTVQNATAGRTFGGVDAGAPRTEVSGTTHSPTALILDGTKTSIGSDGFLYLQEGGNPYAPVMATDASTGAVFQPQAIFTSDAANTYTLNLNQEIGSQRTTEQTMTDQGYVLIGGQWVYQGTTGQSKGGRQTVTVGGGAKGVGTTYDTSSKSYETWLRRQRLDAKKQDDNGIQNAAAGASFTVGTG